MPLEDFLSKQSQYLAKSSGDRHGVLGLGRVLTTVMHALSNAPINAKSPLNTFYYKKTKQKQEHWIS